MEPTELKSASDAALLRAFASLTHRIHAARDERLETLQRKQRDVVELEILRRMAGAK